MKPGRKNDAADAAALCEAARRPEVKLVPVKSAAQQATLALHTARALLVKQGTMLASALRSLAAVPGLDPGIGLVVPLGFGKLGELIALVEAGERIAEMARRCCGRSTSSPAPCARPRRSWKRRSSRTPGRTRWRAGWRRSQASGRSLPR